MGLNHETAPVEVREHFAVPAEQLGSRAKELTALSTIAEGVVLSTCNRMEIYIAAEDREMGVAILRAHLAEGRDEDEMQYLYQKSGDKA